MKNVFGRMFGLALLAGASMTMAVACGGDESKCKDGEKLASIGGAEEQCYAECVDGACSTGFACNGGLCVANATPNPNSNNPDPNNPDPNNPDPNNPDPNNPDPNNPDPNNPDPNNPDPNNNNPDPTCTSELNLGECEPLCATTGCDAGEACMFVQQSESAPVQTSCQPEGAGNVGDACGQTMGCKAGLLCAGASENSFTCQQMCDPNAATSTCDAGDICAPLQSPAGVGICFTPEDECDVFNDTTCPTGERCYPLASGATCVATNGKAVGEACTPPTQLPVECAAGAFCIGEQGGATSCYELCDPTAPACTTGTCQNIGEGLGVCA